MSTNDTEAFDPDDPFEGHNDSPKALDDLPFDDPQEDEPEEPLTEFDKAIFEDEKIDQIIKDYRSSQQNYLHLRKMFEHNKKDL